MKELIHVLIADDHVVVRRGLASMLVPSHGMKVVGEASNGIEAVEMARALQPDVILMDMVMPGKEGPAAIAEIKAENPNARILVLTSFSEDEKIATAIKAGALGYLLKDSSSKDLLQAIRSVHSGNLSLSQALVTKLMQSLQQPPKPSSEPNTPLTQRELDVLKALACGVSNQEIARQLHISVNTVRSHVSSILSKLRLSNRAQAVRYALEQGLISPEQE